MIASGNLELYKCCVEFLASACYSGEQPQSLMFSGGALKGPLGARAPIANYVMDLL